MINHKLYLQENLEWLKNFNAEGRKADVIYIDPPYNIGREKELGYRNKWKGTAEFLAFMTERLMEAKEALSEDGIIFISIGDYSHAPLEY